MHLIQRDRIFLLRSFYADQPISLDPPMPRLPHTYRGGFPPSHDAKGRLLKNGRSLKHSKR